MEEISFNVSAKTARLIGRENISGVNGALLELIKNSYDADAAFCYVKFVLPFVNIDKKYDVNFINNFFNNEEIKKLSTYYNFDGKFFIQKENLSNDDLINLKTFLNSFNSIIVCDDGTGMSLETIKNSWMRIGTNDKEINYRSKKGRIKTGAKGIGRFALDKLSFKTQMFTKQSGGPLISWFLDWSLFDKADNLEQIQAQLSVEDKGDYLSVVKQYFTDKEINFAHLNNSGTIFILHPIRETWSKRLFSILNENLKSINPLNSVDRFDITIFNENFPEYNFKTADIEIDKNDYDYYLKASYDGDEEISVEIVRNELDVSLNECLIYDKKMQISKKCDLNDYWNSKKINTPGYCKDDYSKPFIRKMKVNSLIFDDLENIKKVGPFEFKMYFLKNSNLGFEITKKANLTRRKQILENFSGIKIYRDNFKVRPYGDEGTSYYDWLLLGLRSQKSPAAVSHKSGNWRVEPYQVIGNLSISRLQNPYLVDMANREGMEPNETYNILVSLLDEIVSLFEYDRQYYLREFNLFKERAFGFEQKKVRS